MEQWLNVLHVLVCNKQVADGHFYSQSECTVFGLWGSSTIKSTTDSTELLHEEQLALANLKRWHKIKTGRKGGKMWRAQKTESGSSSSGRARVIYTSFYLAEYDVDYTANHNQSIEDVPGVPDIALIMAACIASRRRGVGRSGGGCRKVEEVDRL